MKQFVKRLLKKTAHCLGYEVRRAEAAPSRLGPFEIARKLLDAPRPVAFDVGANVGQTFHELRKIFPAATIHCFEPFPESFEQLEKVVAESPPSHAHRIALSDKAGLATFSVNASSQTNSLLPTDHDAASTWGHGLATTTTVIQVPTTTIDFFCNDQGIDHIDLLKIDAQGAEYAILQGAS